MDSTTLFRRMAVLCGMGFIACGGMSLYAQEALGPMAGTGGVMRDAERRALAPVPTKDAGKVPPPQTGGAAEPQDASSQELLGVIETVRVFGSTEFAEREEVSSKILVALGEVGKRP